MLCATLLFYKFEMLLRQLLKTAWHTIHMHACTHTDTQHRRDIHTCMHSYILTRTYVRKHTCKHVCTRLHTHTRVHARMHAYTQMHKQIHILCVSMYMQYVASTNSTTILSLRESFNITVGPVTSLAASPDGTLLYVLSPNKVMLL